MTDQSPFPLASPSVRLPPRGARRPGWPRLMNERDAADYLSIGTTMLRERGPAPKKLGGRSLWDKADLDRFADALSGQPLDQGQAESHGRDVERGWLEARARRKGNGNG